MTVTHCKHVYKWSQIFKLCHIEKWHKTLSHFEQKNPCRTLFLRPCTVIYVLVQCCNYYCNELDDTVYLCLPFLIKWANGLMIVIYNLNWLNMSQKTNFVNLTWSILKYSASSENMNIPCFFKKIFVDSFFFQIFSYFTIWSWTKMKPYN